MTSEEMLAWDHAISLNPDGGSVFQSAEIAEVKRLSNWEPLYRTLNGVAVTILQKQVKCLGAFWYIPKGPGVATAAQLADVLVAISNEAVKNNVFVVKIEPELEKSEQVCRQLADLGLVSSRAIQPNSSTVLIDLRLSEHQLLANLNQKTRHAINRAKRDGVEVRPVRFNQANVKIMYNLLVQTAQGRFEGALRPYEYYYRFWEAFYNTDRGGFFFAYLGDEVVAAAFAVYLGKKSTYKDGASLRCKPVYGASHLLQWEVLKWMKDRGCLQHDLCGAPPSDQANNTEHPRYGIGQFKTSFNKQITDYVGAFDLPLHRFKYWLWIKIGERLALRQYYKKHKQHWY